MAVFGLGLFFAAGAASCLFTSMRLPADAPLARMFRTEAELRVLVKAVDTYHQTYGAYPPPGSEGLLKAVAHLDRNVNYLPSGPPTDGWDRPFHYVPGDRYNEPGSDTLRDTTLYPYSPDTYQIYSLGADGKAGTGESSEQRDNITNWDDMRPWRTIYRELNRTYLQDKRTP